MSWNPHTNEMWVLSGNKPWCLTLNPRACPGRVHRGKGSETKVCWTSPFRYLIIISNNISSCSLPQTALPAVIAIEVNGYSILASQTKNSDVILDNSPSNPTSDPTEPSVEPIMSIYLEFEYF